MATSTTGPAMLPIRLAKPFWTRPLLRARRFSLEPSIIRVRQIGITPPSSKPMISREPTRTGKEPAVPETKEEREKPMTQTISTSLCRRVRSATRLTR